MATEKNIDAKKTTKKPTAKKTATKKSTTKTSAEKKVSEASEKAIQKVKNEAPKETVEKRVFSAGDLIRVLNVYPGTVAFVGSKTSNSNPIKWATW